MRGGNSAALGFLLLQSQDQHALHSQPRRSYMQLSSY